MNAQWARPELLPASGDKKHRGFSICIYNTDNDFYGQIRFKCIHKDFLSTPPFEFSPSFDKFARENGCKITHTLIFESIYSICML